MSSEITTYKIVFPIQALAGTLNAGEPVKEPQSHGAGDVENHLPDLDLEIAVRSLRRHHFSSINGDEA